ncbi:M23 family metallopeptidase [Pseudodesulfovibrio sp.]|uniref:M23 family metallopeptidase n=1 Tax=unclassified Pseudodesulfovibrio TaxID=2661612 RepID=UPI003AFFF79E
MSKDSHSLNPSKGGKRFPYLLTTIILVLAIGAGGFLLFRDTEPPTIAIGPEANVVGKSTSITITVTDPGSGLKNMAVAAEQDGKRFILAEKVFPEGQKEATETIVLNKGQLAEGPFDIVVTAQDSSIYPFGKAGKAAAQRSYTLDVTPPRIYVQSHTNNLNQGGSGLLVYALSEKAAQTGIRIGERYFPAYLQRDTGGKYVYYCMFAHPWDVPAANFKPFVEALDGAGNKAQHAFHFHTNPRPFRKDKINLSTSFMERTVPEFQGVPQDKPVLDQYLYINNVIRKQNRAKLIEFGRDTSTTMLWNGPFDRLPNAANRARFADSRDYMFEGKKVDHQTHLGLDLASIRHAEVPAGNDGRVVFADFLGIYGNVVVLDHGLGLQTLYAHLSSIKVKPGDMVKRGEIIAHTGATGLAGGDHLHYGVIVSGTPVQPIEWWDAAWIKHNITSKLED